MWLVRVDKSKFFFIYKLHFENKVVFDLNIVGITATSTAIKFTYILLSSF